MPACKTRLPATVLQAGSTYESESHRIGTQQAVEKILQTGAQFLYLPSTEYKYCTTQQSLQCCTHLMCRADFPSNTSMQVQAAAAGSILSGQYAAVVNPSTSGVYASFTGLLLHADTGTYRISLTANNHEVKPCTHAAGQRHHIMWQQQRCCHARLPALDRMCCLRETYMFGCKQSYLC